MVSFIFTNPPPRFTLKVQEVMIIRRVVVFVLCGFLMAAGSGCLNKKTVSSRGSSTQTATAEDLLTNAIHQLRPENFSIAAATDKPVSLLNSWSGLRLETKPGEDSSDMEPVALPAGWSTTDDETRLNSKTFDDRDASHIRDCLLTHTMSNYLASRGSTEMERIVGVFQFVVRNIALRGDDDPGLPLSTYQILLSGLGSAEDRAWICASVLRQLHYDCIIVKPNAQSNPEDGDWLLGIVVNDQIFLFDARLGIPIPSQIIAGTPASSPATLNDISSHPEWLQQLSTRTDQPYAIDADSLKSPQVMPIVEPDFWSRRMSQLESVLPSEDVCVLFDPPIADKGRPGVIQRLMLALPNITVDKIKPWPHPAQQSAEVRAATSATVEQIKQVLVTFQVPIGITLDKQTGKPVNMVPEMKLKKIRTEQLQGKFEDATEHYLSIRHLELEPSQIPEITLLHRLAAEDSIFWSGLCKFEGANYGAAIEQLSGYLRRFGRKGRWSFPASSLLAECHARLLRYDLAIKTIDRSPPEDPYRQVNALHLRNWNALMTQKKQETTE